MDDDYFNMHLMDSTVPDNHDDNAKKEKDCPQDTHEFEPKSDVITVDEGAPNTAEANNNSDDEEAADVWDESWVRDATLDE